MNNQSATPWGTPWESSRGWWTTDYNNSLTLIGAPLDDVITALADRTERWERDVLGQDIVLGEQGGAFVFRLRGHSWTEVVLGRFGSIWPLPEQSLSARLNTRVISYSVSDTSCYIGYRLYENGELLEELSVLEGGPNIFSSRLRDLKRDDVMNVYDFTSEFLVDQDAFDPGIDFAYFLGRWRWHLPAGDRHRIVNPGFTFMMPDGPVVSVPPIERIDYLALAPLRSPRDEGRDACE
ncbi:MAG: hypothetical protein J2P54_21420 [Bradyrhizobiaceae bacterium]|nr:hypothetical protein [Bradyrhizobiaceae bacterium]